MMLARAAAAALAITLTSCGSVTIGVAVDANFTTAQRQILESKVSRWDGITTARLRVVDDGEWLVLPAPSQFAGQTDPKRKIVRVRPDLTDDGFALVALHELGHVLGLGHTCRADGDTPPAAFDPPCDPTHSFGVMDPSWTIPEFTETDLRECRRVGAC